MSSTIQMTGSLMHLSGNCIAILSYGKMYDENAAAAAADDDSL
jgi:hypothetical protein